MGSLRDPLSDPYLKTYSSAPSLLPPEVVGVPLSALAFQAEAEASEEGANKRAGEGAFRLPRLLLHLLRRRCEMNVGDVGDDGRFGHVAAPAPAGRGFIDDAERADRAEIINSFLKHFG